jgi:hypothetical protein
MLELSLIERRVAIGKLQQAASRNDMGAPRDGIAKRA